MPQEELTRRVRGDWFEIKERIDELYEFEDVFDFSIAELNQIVSDLRVSVEEGVVEYKQRKLQVLFAYLERLQYDSKGFDELSRNARSFSHLVFAVLIQRLIASGAVPIRSGEGKPVPAPGEDELVDDGPAKRVDGPPDGRSETPDEKQVEDQPAANVGGQAQMGMKEVLEEIQQRIKVDPGLKQHPAVKNIFMQVGIYKKELENMQKLAPNILPKNKPAFLANFKQSFDKINEKIREHYRVIQQKDVEAAAKEVVSTNPLKNYDIKGLVKVFTEQSKEFAAVQSTLQFAASERYKTRDILATIIEKKERLDLLVASEVDGYSKLASNADLSRTVSKAFAAELVTVLTRQITRMS